MKNSLLLIIAVFGFQLAHSQDAKMIFTTNEIIWFGLDFSKAKLAIPDAKDDEIKNTLFNEWNYTLISESRYYKEGAFEKRDVYNDLSVVQTRNSAIDMSSTHGKATPITKEMISQAISEYKTAGDHKTGLGCVFFVESFSKVKKEGVAHLVLFDIASRKVLLTERMTGEPGGPGLKYYWAHPFQDMFELISSTKYSAWKKATMGGKQ
ncbi:MAG: hypothetical protein NTY88_10005 [Bacteroidetes bacterium]|nr:hypothetical protein [Bacteroidota bacterium]